MLIEKAIKYLIKEERLAILSYNEIYKNFIFKSKFAESSMIGNTFFISTAKKRFRKQKHFIMLNCCCGVSVQTMIDIMKAYNAIDENTIIKFEVD